MNRFTGKFFALCAVLLLSVAGAVWLYQHPWTQNRDGKQTRSTWCSNEEDCIEEAVYRYQIQNPEGHQSSDLFFLSVKDRWDPNNEVVERLASSSYRVKPVSQSVDQHTVIKDKETGEPGVVLTVGHITWIDKSRVEVALSAYSGFGDAKGYVYELARSENGWMIRNRRFAFET